MIVYDKKTGMILGQTNPTPPNIELYMSNYHDNSDYLIVDFIEDVLSYKIKDNKLVGLEEKELFEMKVYGRFLTEEERILENMKPSLEEVEEAEMTIKILSILEGVL